MPASSPVRVAALAGATAVWGSTFVVTKNALTSMPTPSFLLWRFGLAAVVFAVARPRWATGMDRTVARHGVLLGVFLGVGFLLQTRGLEDVPASVSGFLTGTMVVGTPVAAALVFREQIGRAGWLAVVVAMGGIAALSLRGWSFGSGTGTALTVAGACGFALHIACLSRWATPANAYPLTALSVSVAALLCGLVAALQGAVRLPPTPAAWRAVVYLAVVATCLGFVVQAWAQSGIDAATAAVVMTLEPVFAAALAVLVAGDVLSPLAVVGGAAVVASMFIAEFGQRECCDAMSPRVECC